MDVMKQFLQRILLSLALVSAVGCSNVGMPTLGGMFGEEGGIHVTESKKANPNSPLLKYAASIRINRYADARKTVNPRKIGTGAENVSGMSGRDIILDQDVATVVTNAMKTSLDEAGFQVSEAQNFNAMFELNGVVKELIYDVCGGIRGGKKLKAVIPGGSSAPALTAEEIDIPLEFEAMAAAGTMLGSGAVIVLDETVSIPQIFMVTARFYAHESCGQCTQCREGCTWIYKISKKILAGLGRPADLDLIYELSENMNGKTVCPLAAAMALPAMAFVKKFRHEFLALMKN